MKKTLNSHKKRIAVLVGHAEEKHQKSFIKGLSKEAFSYNFDVCVFAMYNKSQSNKARELGESNIFSLINYELFDAVVLMLETIHTNGMAKKIEKVVKDNFDGPVISLDWESKYFTNIRLGSYEVIKKLIAHLIEEHGYKDIAFLTGRRGHPHSEERLGAYIECMKEHDIPIKNNRIFYGDFWFGSGKNMVERLAKKPENMPQAIACANDYMAIDVAKNLNLLGYRVPEDIAVIGYDHVEQVKDFKTTITSANIPSMECGVYVAGVINAMLQSEEVVPFEINDNLYIGNSCGCECNSKSHDKIYDISEYVNPEENFFSRYNHMMTDLLATNDFSEFMNVVYKYVYQLGDFDNFTICLNSYWSDLTRLNDNDGLELRYTDEVLPVLQCGKTITGNPVNCNVSFETKLMLPELHESGYEPKIYFFTPLFFEERNFGYAVISYTKDMAYYDEVYWLWLRNVMYGLEGLRRISVSDNKDGKCVYDNTTDVGAESFGYRLSMLREEKNISQEELADLLDVSRQSISKWENDKVYPEMTRLLMMSEYFEISLDYLMRGIKKNK